jgi:hypothetical protein
MSVNYLLKDKNAPQSDVKCNSLECNSLELNTLSLPQITAVRPLGVDPITFNDESTCFQAIWESAGAVAVQNSFILIVNLPSDKSNKNIQYSYRSANTQEKLVLTGVAGNVLQFSVFNCSTTVVGADTRRTIDITIL